MPEAPDTTSQWWRSTVVYQIYPRSFADASGDGVGDLAGIRSRLDHLSWLGVDALWLSPVFPSPMADFGYDVSEYCDIDPLFGDLAEFDALVDDAHRRSIRVLLDWVPNHTSDQHPWFLDSRSDLASAHRDFYVWRDPAPGGGPPNNWAASLTEAPAWTFDEATDQYYLHLFLPQQPDLNWANPEVESAMHDTLRFWLDRGVDGFRADVIHCIGKDPALPDDPAELVGLPHCALHDEASTHALLRRIRTLLDGYPQKPMMVGEVYLLDTNRVVDYFGADDELHLSFNFPPLHLPWSAAGWRAALAQADTLHTARDAWPSWVLSNHDVPRHRTRYGSFPNDPTDATGTEERARAAAVLLLTLRGTPYLFQGEELGLLDADVPIDRRVDPGGRDGCRAPIPWDRSPGRGWTEPWLPLPPETELRNVEASRADPSSIVHLYRRLLAVRAMSPTLQLGTFELLEGPTDVVAYRRDHDGDALTVLVNMGDQDAPGSIGRGSDLVVDSLDVARSGTFAGVLAPRQAVVVRG